MEYRILKITEYERWVGPFCELYKKCFSGPINEDIVRWRYLLNPFRDLLVSVAIDQGRLAAHTAASPCELICRGQVSKVALQLNSMTDPAYNGQGLLTALSTKLYDYMAERGYRLVMGFPNYFSNRIFTAGLGWTTLYELPTLELRLHNFDRVLRDTGAAGEDDGFLLEYDSCRTEGRAIYLNKTGAYLRWRYYQNPGSRYKNFILPDSVGKVRSRLICKEYEEKLNIVDFCFAGMEDAGVLLDRAIEYARTLDKEKITVWSQLGTPEHLLFERYNFKNNYPITYFGLKVFQSDAAGGYMYDFRNWSLHAGDDNVY